MKRKKYKAVVFDCDGTLVDTLGDIASCMNSALKKHGFPVFPVESYREKVGWGLRRLAFLSLPEESRGEELAVTLAEEASRLYAEKPLEFTTPYAGMPELVSELKRRKLITAVLTNKPDPLARLVIGGLFPRFSFDLVQGEIPGRPRKPDPACVWEMAVELGLTPADIIFAGDSEVDIETAVSSGCFPLGVSWGYRSVEEIIKAGAKRVIDRPEELLELL